MDATFLLTLTFASIILLIVLIIFFRLQAFIALLVISFGVALVGGVPVTEIIDTIQEGMGSTLGYIAVIIGIGTMVGEMLQVSGGAQKIASTLMRTFGENKATWALSLIGMVVAIPVFFEVALILFIPLVYDLARRTGNSILYFGIPLVAGIAVAHSFIPPTPGPVAVASLIGADLGWVIFFGFVAGVPAAIVGGVYFGKFIGTRIFVEVPEQMVAKIPEPENGGERRQAGFGIAIFIILFPLVLILLNTASDVWLPEGHTVREWGAFIGHPFTALTLTALMGFHFLGTRLGFTRDEVQRIATRSLQPVGMIILLTGAGGVFGNVLVTTGVDDVLSEIMETMEIPVVFFAFLVATAIRVAQGSATVAMVTTAGLVAPVVEMAQISDPLIGATAIAIGCGATVLSHVNDSGFWLVKEYMGMTEKQTLMSWTIMETIVGVTGLLVILLVSLFL